MKILFCNKYNFPFSGTEVYLFELMDLLRAHGHEVALFSMSDSRGASTPFDEWFVPHIDFKDESRSWTARAKLAAHAIYSTDARQRLRQLIARFRPDIAHIRNIYHHLSPSILWELKAQGIPTLYHLNDFKLLCPAYNFVSHGHACEKPCTGKFWKVFTEGCYTESRCASAVLVAEAYFHYWLKTYRKCVDHFLTPSQFAKDLLIRNKFDPPSISVLPHFQKLSPAPPPPALDAPILYFGRLSPEKGVTDLIHAMRSLPQLRLSIAGDGPERAQLERLVKILDLNNVDFLGHLGGEELNQAIAASRFTVLPSHAYETLGKSILESYAWQRPVVASDLGSRRELVHPHETGLLYEPGNVEQLANAISQLAFQPQVIARMGAAARSLIETNHTPEKHYQELMRVYDEMTLCAVAPSRKKPPVRVAFIGGRGVISKYSGIEAYYEEVGKELAALGYAVTIYCRTYFTPNLATHNGMRLVRLPTIRSKHFETVIHTFLSSLHVMFSSNDIVHYHALGPALFSFLPRLAGKKTIVTVQGLDWQRKKWGRIASKILRWGEAAAVRLPNATMVVSKTLQDYYRVRYGRETKYIPNGAALRPRNLPTQLAQWGLEPNCYALFLGRFSPEKNCHLLISAFEKLNTAYKLVLAGGSSHTDAYAAQLQRHQSQNITLLNWVSGDALNELLTNAALFVLPSDLEGLSLALLDAMGAGLCVLTSDIPENREVVDGAGFTFRAGDVDDLARMLGLLLFDPEIRTAAGRSAQRLIQQRYLWPQIARQIAEVYKGVLNGWDTVTPEFPPRRTSADRVSNAPAKQPERVA
ncbi:MAG TPA: glycosyltransferase family 4 protein [Terriglobales bacterium]|nr:glycosyltransferase family 4 protein [Terriglobales bacterium]